MSTFDTLEKSVESSRPIEVFELTLNSVTYRYTNAEDTLTIGGEDFAPESISRSQLIFGTGASNRSVSITVPRSNGFAQQYYASIPGQPSTARIYRYQRDESPSFNTAVLLFDGLVDTVRASGNGALAEIMVQSEETALNRNVPRRTYMSQCNHLLYDGRCQANPSAHNVVGAVTSVSGNVITVTGASASGHDFTGGYVTPVSVLDYRLIIAQSGDDLTLLLPFGTDVSGQNVQAFAGCDHIIDSDCALVFDNVENFGGYAFVPNRNIFTNGIKP
jgi:uncharacterized phage protein (TIGR02218 family)